MQARGERRVFYRRTEHLSASAARTIRLCDYRLDLKFGFRDQPPKRR
jgi:hypothetical protein